MPAQLPPDRPTFRQAFRFWLKLGFVSFGGPAGQIALLHEEVVVRRGWVEEQQFLHALNYCMLLPGPEAQQLATYTGWLLHRTRGALVAGGLFVLPSALILWGLSLAYVHLGRFESVGGILRGLKAAVLALVVAALLRIGKKALRTPAHWIFATLSFAALASGSIPYPVVVFGAMAAGLAIGRWRPAWIPPAGPGPRAAAPPRGEAADPPGLRRFITVATLGLLLWWGPVLALGAWLGWTHTLAREGMFFGKAATVTFGGAYAVLPYVARHAVEVQGWLSPGEMMDGLAFAETTPGPLIMVLQFVGFLGGWHHPGELPPLLAATLGAAITTWATFAPSFLWILLGAPHLESWRRLGPLNTALSAVTAVVVGVILHLAVWLGLKGIAAEPGMARGWMALLALGVFLATARWKWPVAAVVLASGLAGWALTRTLG